ncbi:hypothetical protein QQS21_007624 [Conoideocrella luteorostrata]|uniref:SnoaL-like domain-containing protein n=1 Tax=Conoideocrella luteorostrata TaxID=1105319 RepID=A0AAJ0CMQ5_9HYPO|nr:hypothetical protein QQS21_007624 [Conoideocrella luteorostrata]
MPAPAQVQKATIDKFLSSWINGNAEDTIALWSDDFHQRLLPFSLEQPTQSRAHAEVVYTKLVASLTNWKVDIKHIVHDAAKGTAAIYATSSADTPLPGEKWTNEYSVFLSLSEDGQKISDLQEMVDSAFYKQFFPKFRKYLMEQQHGTS